MNMHVLINITLSKPRVFCIDIYGWIWRAYIGYCVLTVSRAEHSGEYTPSGNFCYSFHSFRVNIQIKTSEFMFDVISSTSSKQQIEIQFSLDFYKAICVEIICTTCVHQTNAAIKMTAVPIWVCDRYRPNFSVSKALLKCYQSLTMA